MSECFDYEIIVGMITTIVPSNYEGKTKSETTVLPVSYSSVYMGAGWLELVSALKEEGIPDTTCHFTDICCEEARYLFGGTSKKTQELIDCLRHCKENYRELSHIFYCPFCGKKLHFVWKNLGTFKLGKEKKEVCAYKFDKVS